MPVSRPSSSDDHDLDALRARHPSAFERLVRNEGRRLYNFIFRMVRDAEEARNLVQEMFLQALLGIDTFRGEANVRVRLHRARNALRALLEPYVRADRGTDAACAERGQATSRALP